MSGTVQTTSSSEPRDLPGILERNFLISELGYTYD